MKKPYTFLAFSLFLPNYSVLLFQRDIFNGKIKKKKRKYKATAKFNIFVSIPSKNERNFTTQHKIVLRKTWVYNNSIDGAFKSL